MMARKFVWKGIKAQVGKWEELQRLPSCQNYQTKQGPPADLPGTVTKISAHKCRPGWTPNPFPWLHLLIHCSRYGSPDGLEPFP